MDSGPEERMPQIHAEPRPGSRHRRAGDSPSREPSAPPLPRPAPCCRTRRWRAQWCSCPRTSPPPNCQPAADPTSAGCSWPLWSIGAAAPAADRKPERLLTQTAAAATAAVLCTTGSRRMWRPGPASRRSVPPVGLTSLADPAPAPPRPLREPPPALPAPAARRVAGGGGSGRFDFRAARAPRSRSRSRSPGGALAAASPAPPPPALDPAGGGQLRRPGSTPPAPYRPPRPSLSPAPLLPPPKAARAPSGALAPRPCASPCCAPVLWAPHPSPLCPQPLCRGALTPPGSAAPAPSAPFPVSLLTPPLRSLFSSLCRQPGLRLRLRSWGEPGVSAAPEKREARRD